MDETQNDAPFVTFYDMHAVTFVLPDHRNGKAASGLERILSGKAWIGALAATI